MENQFISKDLDDTKIQLYNSNFKRRFFVINSNYFLTFIHSVTWTRIGPCDIGQRFQFDSLDGCKFIPHFTLSLFGRIDGLGRRTRHHDYR